MKILKQINNYQVEITLVNNFTNRELTPTAIDLITKTIEGGNYTGSFDIWCGEFPDDFEENYTWAKEKYGVIFEWKVVDYIQTLYPNDKKVKLSFIYTIEINDYDYHKKDVVFSDIPILNKTHKLVKIAHVSPELIGQTI